MPISDQFLELLTRIDQLREDTTAQHQRLRGDVVAGFDVSAKKIDAVRDGLTALQLQVNTIQTQRDMEERMSVKRGAWAGILAGFLFSVLMKLADWLWNPK